MSNISKQSYAYINPRRRCSTVNKQLTATRPVGANGRVVIPFEIRQLLGLAEGDVLLFKVYDAESKMVIIQKL